MCGYLKLATVALAFILAAPLATVAHAERRVALVIGNDQYQNLPKLQKAGADARTYASVFKAKGFDEVILKNDLTRSQLDEAIASFIDQIEPGDTAVFAYSGHGWSDGTQNFIVGTDAPATGSQDFLARISIPLKNGTNGIIDEMDQKGAGLKVAVIDACRDNPFSPPPGKRSIGLGRGMSRIDPPGGTFVVFSAGAGQSALDGLSSNDPDPNSVFTRVFVQTIQADMTLQEAIKTTQERVVASAKSIGEDQKPAYYDEVVGSACLSAKCGAGTPAASTPTVTTPAVNVEALYWNSIVNSTNSADFDAYLRDYPNGAFVALAHNRVAALQPAQREAAPSPGGATPSFNCGAASLPAEMAICADTGLADLDNQTTRQFSAKVMATPVASAGALRVEQLRWLRVRNACRSDRECIANAYRARLQQLGQTSIDVGSGHGPSFSCKAVSLPAEVAICADTELSDLDAQLAQQFSAKVMATGSAGAIRAEQLRWLQGRNACGADKRCLANSYRVRLQQLTQN